MNVHELAQQMTEEECAKFDEERKKSNTRREQLFAQAKAAGFSTVDEFIKAKKANQIHLQPLPTQETPSSSFSPADQVLKMLAGERQINPKLRKLSRLD